MPVRTRGGGVEFGGQGGEWTNGVGREGLGHAVGGAEEGLRSVWWLVVVEGREGVRTA